MGLGWDSIRRPAFVASIIDALFILFFFNAGSIDSFWLILMLIILFLSIIVFLVSLRPSKRVEKEFIS